MLFRSVEKSNDVYLSYSSDAYKSITVSSSPSVTVAITPDGWHRGKQVVSQYEGSFKPTDSDFVVNATDATRRGRLDSIYIYVSESAFSGVTGSVAGDDVNGRGSRKKPYKSIATAVAQCWNGPNDTAAKGVVRSLVWN